MNAKRVVFAVAMAVILVGALVAVERALPTAALLRAAAALALAAGAVLLLTAATGPRQLTRGLPTLALLALVVGAGLLMPPLVGAMTGPDRVEDGLAAAQVAGALVSGGVAAAAFRLKKKS